MKDLVFKTYAVTNEIDLNRIAEECNIKKKYTWEEPLLLQGDILKRIIAEEITENEKVLLFSFGSIVFINSSTDHIEKFMLYMKNIKTDIEIENYERFHDDYALHIDESIEIELTDDYVQIPEMELFYPELISIVIAKSVALERIEMQLGRILDDLESKIDNLEKGKLNIGNKELARITSRIVRHEYNTIAYIMILDKPDITWVNSEAAYFYEQMSEFFELNDRYEIIKNKTEILKNIIDGFSSISHSIRGLFVEWVIVILIVIEVILMVFDLFA
jgi:uncharacterized Rmd1/YagE family protein